MARVDALLEETERELAAKAIDWKSKAELVVAGCHPAQRDAVLDPHRRIAVCLPRGGGKTTLQRARLVLRMLRTQRARCLYIATTRDHAERLMWLPLKDLFERLGFQTGVDVVYNETKLRVTLPKTGAVLWLFGADDKREIDKLRGQPFHEVCIDEAASHSVELLQNLILRVIGPRLGDFGGCICLVGTPGHILSGLFYDATRPGSDAHRPWLERDNPDYAGWLGWSSHGWTLEEAARTVPVIANAWAEALLEKADKKWSDDNPIWMREYLGRWAADDTENVFRYRALTTEGEPWNRWDPKRSGPMKLAELPAGFADWSHVIGMDLGHSDPFALNVFAFSPADPQRRIYHRYGFEQRKMYAQAIAHLLIGEELRHEQPGGLIGALGGWPDAMVADLAGNGAAIIEELTRVYGVRVAAAEKRHKFSNIEVVNGDLVDGRLFVLARSELETQMLNLQWKLDDWGQLKEDKAQANHSTDACIYARNAIARLISAVPSGRAQPSEFQPAAEPRTRRDADDDFASVLSEDAGFDEWFKD